LVAVSFYYLSVADLFQEVYGLSPAELTFWIVPMFAIGIATSLFVGKLLNSGGKLGVLIVVGLILSMVGFAIALVAGAELNFLVFVPATILLGAGPHVIAPAVMQVFVLEAPPKSLGPVTSWHDITGQFGISLGIAGFSLILVALDPVPLTDHAGYLHRARARCRSKIRTFPGSYVLLICRRREKYSTES
jgi:DHA2 family multidrug resistance protein-like MFS transporter